MALDMSNTSVIRQSFINYFRQNGHKMLPRSKVFNDDPTLFFVNSGMNQLKDVFLGQREIDPKFGKLMNSQIAIRAGGKHCDLADVGRDSYHLTSFEMLGNWSINQYGKEEAIRLAYSYLVDVCKLNPEQMYVTYFEGKTDEDLKPDTETHDLWTKYFPENKIIKGDFKDNFWMMGDSGPTGPCTEIHYDMVGGRDASQLVNHDDPTVIEIWNNVFMMYNRQEGKYLPLGKMYVDTGMGLERLVMILQKKTSLYQTDVFRYLFGYAQALTGAEFYTDDYSGANKTRDTAYRIFCDHMRTCIIALHHGVEFDFTGRGFILRKIFRRMVMNLYLYLNDMKICPKMNHPVIKAVIGDVLKYFMENEINPELIQKKLMDEERLYLVKLQNCKRTHANLVKKGKSREEIVTLLKQTHGIDPEIADHVTEISFDMGDYASMPKN
jgi:alanyl-tRNA synthetase